MKLMKNNIKVIAAFILGILCCSITVYAAYNYLASEVSYTPADKSWNVNSVEEALNELHDKYKDTGNGYGVRRRLDSISSAWERVGASIGLEAHAQVGNHSVKNDFDSIYPWSDIISYNYDTDTKQITAYYGEENFTFTPTGNVEVLTRIPEFYYRRYQDDTYEYIYISKTQQEGYIKSEEFSVGRYTMSGNSTRVHSRSGSSPFTNTTITNYRNYARNLGEEFGQLDYHYFILQLLYLVEYADYNSQNKLGLGYTNASNTAPIKSGGCDMLGMKSGSVDGTDNSSMIYRGIEDIFGNIWQFVDGINVKDYQAYICYDKNQYEVDKFDGCYQPLGYVNAKTADNWISKLGYDPNNSLIALPIETNKNSTPYLTNSYITDSYGSNSGNRIALVGSSLNSGFTGGLFHLSVRDTSSVVYISRGSRLLKTS